MSKPDLRTARMITEAYLLFQARDPKLSIPSGGISKEGLDFSLLSRRGNLFRRFQTMLQKNEALRIFWNRKLLPSVGIFKRDFNLDGRPSVISSEEKKAYINGLKDDFRCKDAAANLIADSVIINLKSAIGILQSIASGRSEPQGFHSARTVVEAYLMFKSDKVILVPSADVSKHGLDVSFIREGAQNHLMLSGLFAHSPGLSFFWRKHIVGALRLFATKYNQDGKPYLITRRKISHYRRYLLYNEKLHSKKESCHIAPPRTKDIIANLRSALYLSFGIEAGERVVKKAVKQISAPRNPVVVRGRAGGDLTTNSSANSSALWSTIKGASAIAVPLVSGGLLVWASSIGAVSTAGLFLGVGLALGAVGVVAYTAYKALKNKKGRSRK